jgi:[ribosomal protein S5]-alanine N-acetyltransferase
MPDAVSTRLVSLDDAAELAALAVANRDHLEPWQPTPAESWFSEAGQAEGIRAVLAGHDAGTQVPHVIVDAAGAVVGRIGLNSVIRGAFQSASVGYWVTAEATGRGVATAAVGLMVELAFGRLGLHRVQGETLPHNVASRIVLERNGFVEYGVAPDYLRIAGRWQEHVLYQRTDPRWTIGLER